MNRSKSKTMKKRNTRCYEPDRCITRPIYDRNIPLAMSIPIHNRQPSIQERREMSARAAENRMNLNRSRTPNSRMAEFLNDLDDYNYTDGIYIKPQSDAIRSMLENRGKEERIYRTVHGPYIGQLNDYIRQECIGAHCGSLNDHGYYLSLKNRARAQRQRDLHKRLVRSDIPRSRQQRTLRSRQHDVADRLTEIDEGLNNDVIARVHHFLKKKGHDLDTNKRYIERRGW